jgi:hypothetical protein
LLDPHRGGEPFDRVPRVFDEVSEGGLDPMDALFGLRTVDLKSE